MDYIKLDIQGVFILQPKIYSDARGYFFESFSQREFEAHVGKIQFVQDNQSCSSKGVLRGLHFQKPPFSQAKLVRCVVGKVIDVGVDLREGSPTFGKYVAVELSEENHREFFIPRGFAHGFEVVSDMAVFQYKCDDYYHPEAEGGVYLFDPDLGIEWQTDRNQAIVSEKDKKFPLLKDFKTPFRI